MKHARTRSIAITTTVTIGSLAAGPATAALQFGEPLYCSDPSSAHVEVRSEAAVALSETDGAMIVWSDYRRGAGGDLFGVRSLGDDGFSSIRQLNDYPVEPEPNWAWNRSQASIAVGPGGNTYVVWNDRRPAAPGECPQAPRCGTRIVFTRSHDLGFHWSTNLPLSPTGSHQSQPEIAVSSDGRVHVVWTDNDLGGIFHTLSDDAGRTWTAPRAVAPGTGAEAQLDPDVAVLGDTVYVVWAEKHGSFRVFGARSEDGGASFTPPTPLASSGDGGDERGPEVAFGLGGRAFVTWHDFHHGWDDPDVLFSYATAAGFAPPLRVNDDDGPAIQIHPRIAVDGAGRPTIVFEDYRNGLSDPDVYAARAASAEPPYTFEENVRVSEDAAGMLDQNPAISASIRTGEMIVVWERTQPEGGMEIVSAWAE